MLRNMLMLLLGNMLMSRRIDPVLVTLRHNETRGPRLVIVGVSLC